MTGRNSFGPAPVNRMLGSQKVRDAELTRPSSAKVELWDTEIQRAIEELPKEQQAALTNWLADRDIR